MLRLLPQKIIELHRIVEDTSSSDGEPLRKKRKCCLIAEGEKDDAQTLITSVHDARSQHLEMIVKKECDVIIQLMDLLKLWSILSSPKSDGASINSVLQIHQQDILEECHSAQVSALKIRDTIRANYLSRAKISSKIIKYPAIDDYKDALLEHDEQQLCLVKQHLRDIRNMYVTLNDMTRKNPATRDIVRRSRS
ncbi:proteasome activator pa28 beta subunit-domain-containing protein [Gymnopilus junonius]|uniref:Proteasome activator pa28 beta subunit-domain-containing protein n=1 Tax=Gymnopilus junonius TaxID=109634 RepID=A0A9P5TUM6_GYMJU|nr:proteasome activator pa28 beta subunit-domain-containing protein [Gymnopilus junonius]